MFKLTTLEIHLGGIYTVGDGLLLNKWYHLTYTLSDSEKRMDIFINGVWTAMRSWILSGCVDGEIGNFRYFNWRLSNEEVMKNYLQFHNLWVESDVSGSDGNLDPRGWRSINVLNYCACD
ncbi:glycosyltransferase family 39 protein [Rhizophagus irregularis DAOM 181602=DAOM 197198]|nr:glycosyltransferase family 39 protein [Rhizophagus irregularis DAOM 181602=DAOM 197198]